MFKGRDSLFQKSADGESGNFFNIRSGQKSFFFWPPGQTAIQMNEFGPLANFISFEKKGLDFFWPSLTFFPKDGTGTETQIDLWSRLESCDKRLAAKTGKERRAENKSHLIVQFMWQTWPFSQWPRAIANPGIHSQLWAHRSPWPCCLVYGLYFGKKGQSRLTDPTTQLFFDFVCTNLTGLPCQ